MGDFQIVWHFLTGMIVGVAIIAILSRFTEEGTQAPNSASTAEQSKEMISKESEAFKSGNESLNGALSEARKQTWAGDSIPAEQLELLRKKFRLTNVQMKQVIEASRNEKSIENIVNPMQFLNVVVYVVAFGVIIFFINRDYDNAATMWFIQTFPKESEILGLTSGE